MMKVGCLSPDKQKEIELDKDGNDIIESGQQYLVKPFTLPYTDGMYVFAYLTEIRQGDMETINFKVLKVITQTPKATIHLTGEQLDGTYTSVVSVSVTAESYFNDMFAASHRTECRLNHQSWQPYEDVFTVGYNRLNTVECRTIDAANYIGDVAEVEFYVDREEWHGLRVGITDQSDNTRGIAYSVIFTELFDGTDTRITPDGMYLINAKLDGNYTTTEVLSPTLTAIGTLALHPRRIAMVKSMYLDESKSLENRWDSLGIKNEIQMFLPTEITHTALLGIDVLLIPGGSPQGYQDFLDSLHSEALPAIETFVRDGGRLIAFNHGAMIIEDAGLASNVVDPTPSNEDGYFQFNDPNHFLAMNSIENKVFHSGEPTFTPNGTLQEIAYFNTSHVSAIVGGKIDDGYVLLINGTSLYKTEHFPLVYNAILWAGLDNTVFETKVNQRISGSVNPNVIPANRESTTVIDSTFEPMPGMTLKDVHVHFQAQDGFVIEPVSLPCNGSGNEVTCNIGSVITQPTNISVTLRSTTTDFNASEVVVAKSWAEYIYENESFTTPINHATVIPRMSPSVRVLQECDTKMAYNFNESGQERVCILQVDNLEPSNVYGSVFTVAIPAGGVFMDPVTGLPYFNEHNRLYIYETLVSLSDNPSLPLPVGFFDPEQNINVSMVRSGRYTITVPYSYTIGDFDKPSFGDEYSPTARDGLFPSRDKLLTQVKIKRHGSDTVDIGFPLLVLRFDFGAIPAFSKKTVTKLFIKVQEIGQRAISFAKSVPQDNTIQLTGALTDTDYCSASNPTDGCSASILTNIGGIKDWPSNVTITSDVTSSMRYRDAWSNYHQVDLEDGLHYEIFPASRGTADPTGESATPLEVNVVYTMINNGHSALVWNTNEQTATFNVDVIVSDSNYTKPYSATLDIESFTGMGGYDAYIKSVDTNSSSAQCDTVAQDGFNMSLKCSGVEPSDRISLEVVARNTSTDRPYQGPVRLIDSVLLKYTSSPNSEKSSLYTFKSNPIVPWAEAADIEFEEVCSPGRLATYTATNVYCIWHVEAPGPRYDVDDTSIRTESDGELQITITSGGRYYGQFVSNDISKGESLRFYMEVVNDTGKVITNFMPSIDIMADAPPIEKPFILTMTRPHDDLSHRERSVMNVSLIPPGGRVVWHYVLTVPHYFPDSWTGREYELPIKATYSYVGDDTVKTHQLPSLHFGIKDNAGLVKIVDSFAYNPSIVARFPNNIDMYNIIGTTTISDGRVLSANAHDDLITANDNRDYETARNIFEHEPYALLETGLTGGNDEIRWVKITSGIEQFPIRYEGGFLTDLHLASQMIMTATKPGILPQGLDILPKLFYQDYNGHDQYGNTIPAKVEAFGTGLEYSVEASPIKAGIFPAECKLITGMENKEVFTVTITNKSNTPVGDLVITPTIFIDSEIVPAFDGYIGDLGQNLSVSKVFTVVTTPMTDFVGLEYNILEGVYTSFENLINPEENINPFFVKLQVSDSITREIALPPASPGDTCFDK
ncbi:MAG: hypothetical protein B6I31_00115 [Desulfobacteraceae bacterium 4572_19]|nr:MAG: hypothetical protein B6I31_00115 [Desulfobacteraceae bacterium 4572_19]